MPSGGVMRKVVTIVVLAASLACTVVLAACGSTSSSPASRSPRPSSSLSPQVAQMQALARSRHATEAWYAQVPYSLAAKIMQGGWSKSTTSAEPPSPTKLFWVLIMHGDFNNPTGEHDHWIAITFQSKNNQAGLWTIHRMNTFGVQFKPLPL
jgi:hypothetical protein